MKESGDVFWLERCFVYCDATVLLWDCRFFMFTFEHDTSKWWYFCSVIYSVVVQTITHLTMTWLQNSIIYVHSLGALVHYNVQLLQRIIGKFSLGNCFILTEKCWEAKTGYGCKIYLKNATQNKTLFSQCRSKAKHVFVRVPRFEKMYVYDDARNCVFSLTLHIKWRYMVSGEEICCIQIVCMYVLIWWP